MKNPKTRNLLQLATASAVLASGALHAAPVIYEPFADSDPTLAGNTPGTGLSGTWTAGANNGTYPIVVSSGTALYPPLLAGGNRVLAGANPSGSQVNSNASVSTGTTLGDQSLLNDGTELWFSFLYTVPSTTSINSNFGMAIGTAGLSQTATLGSGNSAVGVSIERNGRLSAAYWGNGLVKGTQSGSTAPGFSAGTTHLIVGQIQWSGTTETINLYLPAPDLLQPAVYSTVTTAGNLDQSGYNVLSFGGKNATATPQGIDEIRFGASYADVVVVNSDATPPTLSGSDIVDDVSGGPILATDTVTYTVTFSEAMNPATIDITDFENAGSPAATINSVATTGDPAVFEVSVSPGGAGTLQLQVVQDAVLEDLATNALDTTSAIPDDTVITVNADVTAPTLSGIVDNVSGGPIEAIDTVIYTVTFSEAMNASTVETADFENNGSPAATINSVTPTGDPAVYEVSVTPGGEGTLQLKIAATATLEDLAGNLLVPGSASPDDTVITVTGDQTPPTTPGFADGPRPASATSVTMTATTSTDAYPSNPVEYWFENIDTTVNSGWQTDTTWVDTGLTEGVEYNYQVKARDAVGNETDFSASAAATPVPDTAAPTPDPMSFAVAPAPTANGTISMTASLATDAYGSNPVEYWFENTTNSTNSGWITSRSWSNSGLTAGVSYDYQVKARDAVGLETAFSATASATAKDFTVAFSEDFELPDVDGYNVANTSGQVPPNWVKSAQGFNSSRSGLVDDVYETTGWSDTDGQQAWAGRYSSNTGITTAEGVIGALAAGQTIVVNFNSMIDTQNAGSDINVYLVTYSAGAAGRDDFRSEAAGAYDILYRFTGTATGTESGYTFSYTAGDNTYSGGNNGAVPFDSANLDKDIALRFEHKNDALVDNVQVLLSTGGGGPTNPYDTWAAGPWSGTLSDADPSLDFDGGSLETGLEWVLGGDPTDGSDDAGIAPTVSEDGTYLVFTFDRSDEANDDPNTTIAVDYGSDLTGWTTAVDAVDGVIVTETPGTPADSVEVKIPKALAVGGKLFARLNVVVNTP